MTTGTATKSLIGRCLDHCSSKEAAIMLQGYPVEVLIAARIKSPVGAGKSLGMEICGRPVSATPILRIVKMVESNEIPVTSEEILAVVNQDERSIRFFKQNPWLIDPSGKSAPPTKKGRKPGNPPKSETNELPEAASKKRERQTRKGFTAPKAKTVASPRIVDPVVEPAEPTPEDIPEEKIEASGEKPKRTIVELPPEYSPEDYLQKPPPPLADDRVQRGPAKAAD